MSFIARTNGATSGQATEVKDLPNGLLDVPSADRGNWRAVTIVSPTYDANTEEQPTLTSMPIAGNGTVSATWTKTAFAASWRTMKLVDLAENTARDKEVSGRVTVLGRPIWVHDAYFNHLDIARTTLIEVWGGATTVKLFAADKTSADATRANIEAAMAAIADYRRQVYAAMDTVLAAIRAGTITTSAQVTGHAAWPA